jgi:hypothetical protein
MGSGCMLTGMLDTASSAKGYTVSCASNRVCTSFGPNAHCLDLAAERRTVEGYKLGLRQRVLIRTSVTADPNGV